MSAESPNFSIPRFEKDPSKVENRPEMNPKTTIDAIVSQALEYLLDGSTFNEVRKLYLDETQPSLHDRGAVLNSLYEAKYQQQTILDQQKRLG